LWIKVRCVHVVWTRSLKVALSKISVVSAGARLVDIALEEGSMFKSDGWKHIEPSFEKNTVHFIGLCSNGGVHSRLDQVCQFIDFLDAPECTFLNPSFQSP
jgi:bisphosphoglycerate-independent phosphoglycerate mutase (AlkP superfamily)